MNAVVIPSIMQPAVDFRKDTQDEELRSIAYWDKRYLDTNIFGQDPSKACLELLDKARDMGILPEKPFDPSKDTLTDVVGLELCAGEGRDTRAMLHAGIKRVILNENSLRAIGHIQQDFELSAFAAGQDPRLIVVPHDYRALGVATGSMPIARIASIHRTWHLLDDAHKKALMHIFSCALDARNDSVAMISARNHDDYNRRQMRWLDKRKGIAEYTLPERAGHIIHFADEKSLTITAKKAGFVVIQQGRAQEMESSNNIDPQTGEHVQTSYSYILFTLDR